ncbi:MAG TPA: DUF1453 domain-containing protein [Pseudonocardiaceae bacterium]|jgi:hypothetical protein|nr:DUF1453 domain-containing protein [Pseudonocardiaceae bacterium]
MSDALSLGGILLVVVFITQIGRRRHNFVLAIMPFISCILIGWLVLTGNDITLTEPNVLTALVGAGIGIVFGILLNLTMRVYREPAKGNKAYVRAGIGYLGIWLFVLVGRIAFVWLMENNAMVATHVGEFMMRNNITEGGLVLFFTMMALVMALARETVLLRRIAKLPAGSGRSNAVGAVQVG